MKIVHSYLIENVHSYIDINIVQLPAPGAVDEYNQVQAQTPIHYCSIEINMPEGSIRVSSDIKPEVLQMLIREVKNA